jgi:Y_Y_Y domain/LytTr DNA-binding domain
MKRCDEDLFWVTTNNGGVTVFNKSGKSNFTLFSGENINEIYRDHEQGIWVASLSNGAYHLTDWNIQNNDPGKNQSAVTDMVKDQDNKLWVAYENGMVVRQRDTGFEVVHQKAPYQPAHLFQDTLRSITYYSSNQHLFDSRGPDSIFIKAHFGFEVYDDKGSDSVLIYHHGGLYTRKAPNYRDNIIIHDQRVMDFQNFRGENYYLCTAGLCKLSVDTMVLVNEEIEALTDRFETMAVFRDFLILGSAGKGIVIYNGKKARRLFNNIASPTNYISNLYVENDSVIWISTNGGLNQLTVHNNRLTSCLISADDGLISNEITDVEIIRDTIWIGTRQGLSYIPKNNIRKPEVETFYLDLYELIVNDQSMNMTSEINLSYNQNRLEFRFSAVSFAESEELQYRYRMTGLNESWTYSNTRSALYSAMPDGDYTFVVQVKGRNDNWSTNERRLRVVIYPPFWDTWWFISLMIVISLTLVYLFFKYRVLIYNGDVLREILRQLLKKLRRKDTYLVIKESGREIKIDSSTIQFVKSEGNYLEIHTDTSKHVIRGKISKFLSQVPDPLEFIQVKRSFIVRIDKVQEKGKKYVIVKKLRIEVGETFLDELEKIHL